jgi:hypothetical protein
MRDEVPTVPHGIPVAPSNFVVVSRPRSFVLGSLLVVALGALALGCDRRDGAVGVGQLSFAQLAIPQAQAAQPPAQPATAPQAPAQAPQAAPAAPRAGVGEQILDTGVVAPPPQALPAPQIAPAPVAKNPNRKVRTPDDEHLPKWVPVKGRLTVVESSDLAENLGLVPKGSSKKSAEPISVADKLADEADARRASANGYVPSSTGVSPSYAAGRITNHR